LPEGLRATLRPYQQEGYHFLSHLSSLGLGGILADDMGLGKTVQTLAWLLNLANASHAAGKPFRALVVCPKSVTHGWLTECARFTPALIANAYNPWRANSDEQLLANATPDTSGAPTNPHFLIVANYSQLRINASWFKGQHWDAVVLDEGQFIKNPGSQVAATARALVSRHRLVLTGTPIENRLTDLWSLFAFAQPGLLGTQTSFRRQHDQADAAALARLHRRVRHFLLRRTKAEAAPDLPSRTEDDLIVELEGEQRSLYDAELKRARAQLLGVQTSAQLASVRFNVLASLLRLRQICCHPALVDPAHRDLPSAKLDALLERLEELQEEGHQVLVFSQFVGMLEIIRDRLVKSKIDYLMLTGATENRAEMVNTFQTDKTKTVFLLSLKAAGFGLNLTAASYAILYDPWWNPAAEAQAIDRTHRIGQTQPVVAYRLLAEGTVEEKIRSLQKEKAALAAAVVQEESLAQVLDLDSLRRILE
jgi:SNF2 family DNA or RNA helicase